MEMQKEHLGIAKVPCQTWGELYTQEEALKIGTIFKELNKPFFAVDLAFDKTTEKIPQKPSASPQDREAMLTQIMEISFVLDDLTLYLDTHEKDQEALSLFQELSRKRDGLKNDFAKNHYPLTRDCMAKGGADQGGFSWLLGPAPWEGACA
jgi:hypothetical protein